MHNNNYAINEKLTLFTIVATTNNDNNGNRNNNHRLRFGYCRNKN